VLIRYKSNGFYVKLIALIVQLLVLKQIFDFFEINKPKGYRLSL